MSEISEYEARITAALERIGRAVAMAEERAAQAEKEVVGGIDPQALEAEVARLNEALEAERDSKTQLEERVRAIHDKQNSHVASLEGEVETLRNQIFELEGALGSLRAANDALRANNAALRDANAKGVSDPDLINEGLQAEVTALETVRASTRVELDGVISDLKSALPQSSTEV
ncbi:hypothetical protein [Celeribacter sp.]|uniref:hypothetical protein n=1 Tax=Celeribacter sp. TaxID=1890673 RepID=UPI003A8D2EAB